MAIGETKGDLIDSRLDSLEIPLKSPPRVDGRLSRGSFVKAEVQ